MLKKLVKYEIKKINKFLIIFYSLAIIMALLTRITGQVEDSFIFSIIAEICSGATIAMIFSIIINTVMRLWIRFKNTLYDDESYLTHTLPIDSKTIYTSKMIIAILTVLSSLIMIILTLFIAYYSKDSVEMLKALIPPLFNDTNAVWRILCLFLVALFLQVICIAQTGYTSIILGHRLNYGKVAFSVLIGVLAYAIIQLFALLLIFLISCLNNDFMILFNTSATPNTSILKSLFYLLLGFYFIIISINFFINTCILKKGVNVE